MNDRPHSADRNTKITTKNRDKNKFQPAFNVKVYLQTKTDKIILSRSITGLLTPNIFFSQDFATHLHPPPSIDLSRLINIMDLIG